MGATNRCPARGATRPRAGGRARDPGRCAAGPTTRPGTRRFAASGLAVATWPVEYGGLDLSPAQARVAEAVLAPFNLGRLNPLGLNSAAPALFAYGTEEQRLRFLPPLVRNEEKWCQLLSEPGAGSDLASLATRAVRDGEEWVLDGQKVWTTWAHVSRLRDLPRPHRPDGAEAAGAHLLHRRPARARRRRCGRCATSAARSTSTRCSSTRCASPTRTGSGATGDGWRVAGATLAGERQMVSGSGSGGVDRIGGAGIDRVLAARGRARAARADPVVRQRLDALYSEERIRGWTNQRVRGRGARRRARPGRPASIGKVHQGALNQRLQLLAADLLGAGRGRVGRPPTRTLEAWAAAMPFEVRGRCCAAGPTRSRAAPPR